MFNNTLDIDLIPVNVAVYKKDGDDFTFIGFNKAAQKIENISADTLIGKKLTEVFPGVKEFGLFEILLRVEESGISEVYETEFYSDDRVSGWRHNEIVKLEDGVVAAFYSDKNTEKELESKGLILSKKLNETEKKLEHQKKVFQEIIESSESISVQGYNQNHEVIYWNRASELIYGYTEAEALGKKLENLIVPTSIKKSICSALDDWITKDKDIQPSELTLHNKNGEDVNVFSHHSIVREDSNNIEIYRLDIDLKDVKKLQIELKEERNFLRSILNVIPDLVWLKDINGVYLKCNPMFEKLYGAKEAQILNKTDFDFVDKELAELLRANDSLAIKANQPTTNEEYFVYADGSAKGIHETVKTPLKDINGNIIGVLGISRDISERKEREKQLEHYANYDTLTGLTNRVVFNDRLNHLLSQRIAQKIYHAVLFIDLDRFKEINDTMGHSVGDQILIMVANRLKSITRKGDTLARIGGDEFTMILQNINNPLQASIVCDKILSILKEPLEIDGHHFHVTSSIGISIYPDDSTSSENLVKYADSAMYHAKENGKNNYQFYTKELSLEAIKKVSMANYLQVGIKNEEFELYYQPQIDSVTKILTGAEALIRWNSSHNGLISPMDFIPFAESSGQIIEIGKWVIIQAMRDIVKWKKNNLSIDKVSINLSIKQLSDKGFISSVVQSLKQTNCKPEWIEFEITESSTMNDPESSILLLNEIKNLGFTLSIDDFGTGYSSLSYLKKLPINKLKIDKSFVDDIFINSDDEAIVQAVILIAKSMKIEVIAEGVETQNQQKFLIENGCNLSQGYFYSKPLKIKEFEKFVMKQNNK